MLGGTFWIAFLRNAMGAVMVLAVFLLLDRPRMAMKKAVLCYLAFGLAAVTGFTVWYFYSRDAYLRFSGLAVLPILGSFCCLMSGDGLYLSLYKISVGFYLLSVCVCLGVDLSRWGFGGSLWADLGIRFLFISVILTLVVKKYRRAFFENIDFLQDEMDLFSVITLVVSVVLAALAAYWPDKRVFSTLSMVRILVGLSMAGIIQYLIFHLYIHLGKEQRLEAEKRLVEMNELLLRRQLEMREKAQQNEIRLRHNMLDHYLLIKESATPKDRDEILDHLLQCGMDMGGSLAEPFCGNKAVNGILSIYEEYAKSRDIGIDMEIQMSDTAGIRDMDLVMLLANILENAIGLCVDSGEAERYIGLSVAFKSHKMVIQCQNTCGMDVSKEDYGRKAERVRKGSRDGTGDIVRIASRYHGETDFQVENRVFHARVLLNLPKVPARLTGA